MKRAKRIKCIKNEENTELESVAPSIHISVKSTRISDLNKSKYLSPCRSVGLNRKRKISTSVLNKTQENRKYEEDIIKKNIQSKIVDSIDVDCAKENIYLENDSNASKILFPTKNEPKEVFDSKAEDYETEHKATKYVQRIKHKKSIVGRDSNSSPPLKLTKGCGSETEMLEINSIKNNVEPDTINSPASKTILENEIMKPKDYKKVKEPNSEKVLSITIEKVNLNKNVSSSSTNDKANSKLTSTCIAVINKRLIKKKSKEKVEAVDSDPDFEDLPLSKVVKLGNLRMHKDSAGTAISHSRKQKVRSVQSKSLSSKKKSHSANSSKVDSRAAVPARSTSNLPGLSPADSHCNDEDDFVQKKTILERKSYERLQSSVQKSDTVEKIVHEDGEKVLKVHTTSNMSTTNEKDLELSIETWRKGCQDALCELLDVTRQTIPGNENIDMETLLDMLKLPSNLVKYNSDQCCFE